MRSILCTLLALCVSFVGSEAFLVASTNSLRASTPCLREGSFVSRVSHTKTLTVARGEGNVVVSRPRISRGGLRMGKVAKFGVFSPAVIGAKVALGETRLNKIRGKAIALHSQVITEYCRWVGASSRVRGLLIRKAKSNGDDLGFLW